MKRRVGIGALAFAFACLAPGQMQSEGGPTKSQGSGNVENALMQMERDWTNGEVKKDITTLDRILADDWVGIDAEGKAETKMQFLESIKSSESKIDSATVAEMKVRIFGDTAVVTGINVEKSQAKGKDTSGRYVWTDVFVKRNGRWQAVASQWVRASAQ